MRFEGKIGRPAAALLLVWLLAGGAARAQLAIAGAAIFEQGVGGFPDDAEPADAMGQALATGDFDGDGRDDLAIASPGETVFAGADGAGQVTVVYGSATGLDPGSGVPWATVPFAAPRRFSSISVAYGPVTAHIESIRMRKPPANMARIAGKSNSVSINAA